MKTLHSSLRDKKAPCKRPKEKQRALSFLFLRSPVHVLGQCGFLNPSERERDEENLAIQHTEEEEKKR